MAVAGGPRRKGDNLNILLPLPKQTILASFPIQSLHAGAFYYPQKGGPVMIEFRWKSDKDRFEREKQALIAKVKCEKKILKYRRKARKGLISCGMKKRPD